jgi:hypothetical protein
MALRAFAGGLRSAHRQGLTRFTPTSVLGGARGFASGEEQVEPSTKRGCKYINRAG